MRKHIPAVSVVLLFLALGLIALPSMQHESAAAKPGLKPNVVQSGNVEVSPALHKLMPIMAKDRPFREIPRGSLSKGSGAVADALHFPELDSVLQETLGGPGMPDPIRNFEGVGNLDGVAPPDTQGDVGPNHYVQWVNSHFQVWDKNGNSLYGPAAGNTLWQSSFGQDACKNTNNGDPITLYDQQADRWLMSQFALPNYPDGPFYQCIAISTTGDPTGPYYLYQFQFSAMNDYPKLGVWPDGYYMTINQFASGTGAWVGGGAVAFERSKMLEGLPAQMVYFNLGTVNVNFGGMLPSDWDGALPPPAGAPNYFAEVDDSTWIAPTDALRLWKFHVDWASPANSSFGLSGQPNAVLPIADFTPICSGNRDCIPQPVPGGKVDAIGDRLMHRLQYRNFEDHEALVTNHTVDAGSSRASIRWYEIRDPGGTPAVYQQGTYAPADSEHRWMGSIAMDHVGNMALGYSVSSGTVYPSIRYTGRIATDPPGQMPQGETELITGLGSQTNVNRWGDYSMMAVDPVDDCTFWYTQEYVKITGSYSWNTRIGSFKLPSCTTGPTGTLQGTVSDAGTGNPIAGAAVTAGANTAHTNGSGQYRVVLPTGTYDMTASASGYLSSGANGLQVNEGQTTTQDFTLTTIPPVHVCGTVSDGSGHGWGLYARIDIAGSGYSGGSIFTDPTTGQYCVDLLQGQTYTFTVTAMDGGYTIQTLTGPAAVALNFALTVDVSDCPAGYTQGSGSCTPLNGGLVTGNVYDANTQQALNDAVVDGGLGSVVHTRATPEDPGLGDGFYSFFLLSGARTLNVTMNGGYGSLLRAINVSENSATREDFHLPAGHLGFDPPSFTVDVELGTSKTANLVLSNTGGLAAAYELKELKGAPAVPTGPFQKPNWVVKSFKQGLKDTEHLPLPPLPTGIPTINGAGDVLRSWPSNLSQAWPIAYDGFDGTVWVGSPASAWGGSNTFYEYSPGGTRTGRSTPFSWSHYYGPAEAAYNWNTGKLWVMNVADYNNCIYEIDPAAGPTGTKICPGGASGFAYSQRGLAYDPTNDTYFAGSWNDYMVHHFDANGVLLDEVNVGVPIAGLAYNPDTRHLFAVANAYGSSPSPIYVLDAANNYAIVGQFSIPGFTNGNSGAGLEIDCDGNLWAVDMINQKVYQVSSGETAAVCLYDVPWVSANPASGALAAGADQPITITFDASVPGMTPGQYHAQFLVKEGTPYTLNHIAVTMNVVGAPHTITASAGTGGKISPAGAVSVPYSNDQAFVITTDPGYVLTEVLVDGVSVGAVSSYTFRNVTAHHTIAAQFAKTWNIRASCNPGGSISPAGTLTLLQGQSQSFTIKAAGGYQLKAVYVDGVSVGTPSSYTFQNVSGDHTISAVFVKFWKIRASAGRGGAINPKGTVWVEDKKSKIFKILPKAGFHISQVYVDGKRVGPVNRYTFKRCVADHTIKAVFAR